MSETDWDYPEAPECPPGKEMDQACLEERQANWPKKVRKHRNEFMNALGAKKGAFDTQMSNCTLNQGTSPLIPCQQAARKAYADAIKNLTNWQNDKLDDLKDHEQSGCKADCCKATDEEGED